MQKISELFFAIALALHYLCRVIIFAIIKN